MSLCVKLNIISNESKLKIDKIITDIYQNTKDLNKFIDSDQIKFKSIFKIIIQGKYYPDFVYTKMWFTLMKNFPYKSFVKLKFNNNLIQKCFVNIDYKEFLNNHSECNIFVVNLFSNFVLFLNYFFTNYTKKLKLRIKYSKKNIQKYINKYNLIFAETYSFIKVIVLLVFNEKIAKNLNLKNQIILALKENDIEKLLLSFYDFKIIKCLPKSLPILLLYSTNIIDPLFWGSLVWRTLHFISEILRIKKNDEYFKKYTYFLFNCFYRYIPCDLCKNHWKILLENNKNSLETVSTENFNKLIWKFHQDVNNTNHNAIKNMSWENYVANDQKFYEKLVFSLN